MINRLQRSKIDFRVPYYCYIAICAETRKLAGSDCPCIEYGAFIIVNKPKGIGSLYNPSVQNRIGIF